MFVSRRIEELWWQIYENGLHSKLQDKKYFGIM